jgi:hypothetical protein
VIDSLMQFDVEVPKAEIGQPVADGLRRHQTEMMSAFGTSGTCSASVRSSVIPPRRTCEARNIEELQISAASPSAHMTAALLIASQAPCLFQSVP